jgi:hypothetical protein
MSAVATSQVFASIRVVGGLLPADMLARIADGKDISASKPADYHVVGARSVQDEAERHWDYLKGAWRALRAALGDDSHDPAGLATENWLLPLFEEHGFGRLQRLPVGIYVGEQASAFSVSHRWEHVPVHLAAWDADLDKRPSSGGLPPQSMLQECLNRSPAHLWGIMANGRHLRILRDSTSLVGSSYIDVDLEAMFDGELVSEFVVLYRLLHVSRYEIPDGAAPSACRMERWRAEAIEAGARALDQLRDGVQNAIAHLGTGFLRHPANTPLRDDLDADLFKRALLRLVYRLLFWFVAEDRDVLLSPGADESTKNRYQRYFSSRRLRATALRRAGTTHGDLWQAAILVMHGLGDEGGLPQLGLPGLGGIYDDTGTDQILHGLELSNEHLLAAIRALARVHDPSTRRYRPVDYRNLGAEELGSIYESLLELVPKWSKEERRFLLDVMPGNERKSTGSYYTPTTLIDCLLDTALDPVLDDAQKRAETAATAASEDPATAIAHELLAVTVCDPACGSGHFLVAAARRIAKRLAMVREHNPEPTLEALRTALRDVVSRCIYGVDINPMAVELAKVSLWLEALEPGKPLGFLDARIKCGNALIGATPALIVGGVPDDAFKPIEGDDRQWAASLRRANTKDSPQQDELFDDQAIFFQSNEKLASQLSRITDAPGNSLRDVHSQAAAYRTWEDSPEYRHARKIADAWCSAFTWIKTKESPPAVVNRVFRALREQGGAAIPPPTSTEIERLRAEFGFFHWHLEFPDIFHVPDGADPSIDPAMGWSGGFTCILGNPPWENIEFKESEFFGSRDEKIAVAVGSKRKNLIADLSEVNPELYDEYRKALRSLKEVPHYVTSSASYPLYARGMREVRGANRYKTDALFLERCRTLLSRHGRLGMVLPTGVATDAVTQFLFQDITRAGSIVSLYDFENLGQRFFKKVDSRYKFCLLSLCGFDWGVQSADFSFFLHDVAELDSSDKHFWLTEDDIFLLNPNTGTCPIFRTPTDAAIALTAAKRFSPLRPNGSPGPYQITLRRVFNMGEEDVFSLCLRESIPSSGHLPMYESKLMHSYNHRYAYYISERRDDTKYSSTSDLRDPSYRTRWRYSIGIEAVQEKLAGLWDRDWLLGWGDVARNNDERTLIATILPLAGTDYTLRIGFPKNYRHVAYLTALFNSFIIDFLLRLRQGGLHVADYILEQLPIPDPLALSSFDDWIVSSVIELSYTSYDVQCFARDMGESGQPFCWNDERRFLIRAELDALFFRLYGIEREDVDYIMETFPIVKRKDVAKHGSYRTKEMILAFYDCMAAADAASVPYESTITPAPGLGPRHSGFSARAVAESSDDS